jgi:hypothetical protein
MNIARIKFYQAIKCSVLANGRSEFSYLDTGVDPYSISLTDNLLCIKSNITDEKTYTTLTNVVYFTECNEKTK